MSNPAKRVKTSEGPTPFPANYSGSALELKCIHTIRAFSIDMPQTANSGHPGAPLGCAPITHLLFSKIMKYSVSNPKWYNRDRFILSNGHACALLYTMLHLAGYELSVDDCKLFRQAGSKTPGHPECFATQGVEVCTGPLGQGISNAVGLAIAECHLAATYNTDDHPLFTNFTYVLCGDGCLEEGVSSESCSLAGHLGLGKLIVFYDDNKITIDGDTVLSFTEDVAKRFDAYGWHVQKVDDVASGIDVLDAAVTMAKAVSDKPSIICIRTKIGYGSQNEGSHKTHGAPLGIPDVKYIKEKFGLDPEKTFQVDDDVKDYYKSVADKGEESYKEWEEMFNEYKTANPDKAAEIERRFKNEMPSGIFDTVPDFGPKELATRQYSNKVLNALAPLLPELVGGSADLTPSNLTALACSGDFQKNTPEGRYLRFGVREHGMAAISNGLFAYGGFRPFCATFLNFAGYALGAMRLSALSKFGVLYIMTHDSIGLGEDGPTHQPVETLEILRSTPNMNVYRPADGKETMAAYKMALTSVSTPTVICGSRSTLPFVEHSTVDDACKGGYIAVTESNKEKLDLVLIGTGSELGLCIDAAKQLSDLSVRVVSMPCQEIFLSQTTEYQQSVLPGSAPTLSVEASSEYGWHRFSHAQIGMTRFGLSGTGKDVFKKFGFSVENVVSKSQDLLKFYETRDVPNLANRPVFENYEGGDGH